MDKLSNEELIENLSRLGLHPGGTRARMVDRLNDYLKMSNIDEDAFVGNVLLLRPENQASSLNNKEIQSAPANEPDEIQRKETTLSVKPKKRIHYNQEDLEPSDSISQVSSTRSRNSIVEQRATELAKSAGLTAKLRKMKELYDLEDEVAKMKEAERSLVRKREVILLEAEIMESEAKEKTLKSFQDSLCEYDVTANFPFQAVSTRRDTRFFPELASTSGIKTPSPPIKPTPEIDTLSDFVPDKNKFKNTNYTDESVPKLSMANTYASATPSKSNITIDSSLMETLVSYNMKCLMPKIEMQKFDGDFTKYTAFIKSFDNLICRKLSDDNEKLFYLDQHTSGKPNEVVKSCLHMDSSRGYQEARRLLHKRYGNPEKIVAAYIQKVFNWPAIHDRNIDDLDEFSIVLRTCRNATVDEPYYGNELEHPKTLLKILEKLPYAMQDRWRRKADNILEGNRRITFEDLVGFIETEARIATNPLFGKHLFAFDSSRNKRNPPPKQSVSINALKCWKCDLDHMIDTCPDIETMSHDERLQYVKSKGMCFQCLGRFHKASECKSRFKCKACQGNHNTILHKDKTNLTSSYKNPEEQEIVNVNTRSNKINERTSTVKMLTVPVKIMSSSGKQIETYAVYDNGSTSSFITKSLLDRLDHSPLQKKKVNLNISTINRRDQGLSSYQVDGLIIKDLAENYVTCLPPIYTLSEIPADDNDKTSSTEIHKWPHLKDIDLPEVSAKIEVMLGLDAATLMIPLDVKRSKVDDNEPHAILTKIGWVVVGLKQPAYKHRINRIIVNELYKGIGEDDIFQKGYSAEDLWWLQEMNKNVKKTPEGYYELPLPIRDRNQELPKSINHALKRMAHLKTKMKDDKFSQEYKKFMIEMMSNGYMEEVPINELKSTTKVWYIPHFGVYHPQKPEKIRIVFDCAAKMGGLSLNDVLVQGPDLASKLVKVLLKFRQGAYAFMADVKTMFYQVKVAKKDRDYLRFFWWKDGNVNGELKVYRMTTHLFGASSSPACANFALQKTAKEYGNCFPSGTDDIIFHNFYVDDCLKASDSKATLLSQAVNVKKLCAKGGFVLTKFYSHNPTILKNLPHDDPGIAKEITDKLALGLVWDKFDNLKVRIPRNMLIHSKRDLLSMIASIYDPLGILSPITIKGRIILQECCKRDLDWDDTIDIDLSKRICDWGNELNKYQHVALTRNINPTECKTKYIELHHFTDASSEAYGLVSYLRFTNFKNEHFTSFVFGKGHITPLKTMTIPRLELSAATLAIKVNAMITRSLDFHINNTYYWTDSTTVLNYIRNTKTRFRIFVANRLKTIWEGSLISQWRYVDSKSNPADDVSRGFQTQRWVHGPEFLRQSENSWPKQPDLTGQRLTNLMDKEVKKVTVTMGITSIDSNSIFKLLTYYSSWNKLVRTVVWLTKFILYLKESTKSQLNPAKTCTLINADDIKHSERTILMLVQKHCFNDEYEALVKGREIKISSSLSRLKPIMVDQLLRVGGRLSNSNLQFNEKYPIILPSNHHVTSLIIQHIHESVGHCGRNYVLSKSRECYWVIHGNSTIRKVLRNCLICKKFKAPPMTQVMADLPSRRLDIDETPFTHTGVDVFGPFYVKYKRSQIKRYGIIFTCLVMRAVHIEMGADLSIDSFINALRRFLARRGSIISLSCDNGTNFHGASTELAKAVESWNCKQINDFLNSYSIKWHFNPPYSSNFGGAWERLIRSIRSILNITMREQVLNEDQLNTLFCEAEAIINGRPLTSLSDDPNDLCALTPSHLLTLKPGITEFVDATKTDCLVKENGDKFNLLLICFGVDLKLNT